MTPTQQQPPPGTRSGRRVILGMGTGRCGSHTLAELLSRQPDTQVTHEQPPLLAWKPDPGRDVMAARLERLFRTRPQARVGDVASFYLPYVEAAIAREPQLRVICLERPREEVVASFCAWIDVAHPLPTDHWSVEPARGWYHEPVWTRIFPQYPTKSREEGLRRYWDEYHTRATGLMRRFPNHVRLFPMAATFNTEGGMREMLTFAGIPPEQQVLLVGTRQASAATTAPHPRRGILATAGPGSPARCAVLVPYADHIRPACENALRVLEQRGYTVHRVPVSSDPCNMRNYMATDALTEGFEETLWVGPDIAFDPDDVEKLRGHGAPIVCGLYPEVGRMAIAFHPLPGTPHILFGAAGGLVEIQSTGAGFLLVRRPVYMEMIRRLGLPLCNEHLGRPMIPFFQTALIRLDDGSWLLGEEHAFCDSVRSCGYQVLADTTIRLWREGCYSYGWEDAGLVPPRYSTFHLTIG